MFGSGDQTSLYYTDFFFLIFAGKARGAEVVDQYIWCLNSSVQQRRLYTFFFKKN